MSKEQNTTKYVILTSTDEGATTTKLGEVQATSSQEALRKFFAEPPRDEASLNWFAAVSENSMRWRQVAAQSRISIREAEAAQATLTAGVPEDTGTPQGTVNPQSLRA